MHTSLFFFNGGIEDPVEGEDRALIHSPEVATLQSSAGDERLPSYRCFVGKTKENKYDVIILNFANPDMVGYTGFFEAM